MNKLFTLFLLALLPIAASAQVEIDGIYYLLHSGETNTAEVTVKSGGYSGVVVIPASVTHNNKTYSVTSIGRLAFKNCSGLTSVTIPNSVNYIGERAFGNCI